MREFGGAAPLGLVEEVMVYVAAVAHHVHQRGRYVHTCGYINEQKLTKHTQLGHLSNPSSLRMSSASLHNK